MLLLLLFVAPTPGEILMTCGRAGVASLGSSEMWMGFTKEGCGRGLLAFWKGGSEKASVKHPPLFRRRFLEVLQPGIRIGSVAGVCCCCLWRPHQVGVGRWVGLEETCVAWIYWCMLVVL